MAVDCPLVIISKMKLFFRPNKTRKKESMVQSVFCIVDAGYCSVQYSTCSNCGRNPHSVNQFTVLPIVSIVVPTTIKASGPVPVPSRCRFGWGGWNVVRLPTSTELIFFIVPGGTLSCPVVFWSQAGNLTRWRGADGADRADGAAPLGAATCIGQEDHKDKKKSEGHL